jgi:hypothetical protein
MGKDEERLRKSSRSERKSVSNSLPVEKRRGTPYRTGSYLPGGATSGKPRGEEAG